MVRGRGSKCPTCRACMSLRLLKFYSILFRAHLPRGGVWETRVGVIATLACLSRRTIGLARKETPRSRGFFLNCVTHEWSVPRPRIGPHSKNCEEGRCTLEVSGPVVRTGSEYCRKIRRVCVQSFTLHRRCDHVSQDHLTKPAFKTDSWLATSPPDLQSWAGHSRILC